MKNYILASCIILSLFIGACDKPTPAEQAITNAQEEVVKSDFKQLLELMNETNKEALELREDLEEALKQQNTEKQAELYQAAKEGTTELNKKLYELNFQSAEVNQIRTKMIATNEILLKLLNIKSNNDGKISDADKQKIEDLDQEASKIQKEIQDELNALTKRFPNRS